MLVLVKSGIFLSKRPKIPMFLGGIPSLLLCPNPISVPLFILVIYGFVLLMVLDEFTLMASFVVRLKSIIISFQLL